MWRAEQAMEHATDGVTPHLPATHRKGGSLPQKGARLLLAALLLVAPWLFGATEDWSWSLLQGLTGLGFLAAVCGRCWNRRPFGSQVGWPQPTWNWWWGAPLIGLTAFLAAQAANPSHLLCVEELRPLSYRPWWPHTVDAPTTCQTLLKLLTYAALFWTVRVAYVERRQAWTLLTVLAVSGFLLAMAGLTQQLSGSDRLLGLRKAGPFSFGPFVNRNNYAAYANLLIPAALAVAHHRRHLAQTVAARSHAGGLFVFMALIMVWSVVMTASRAGIVVCAGLLLAWGALELRHVIRGGGEARRLFLMVVLAAVALIAGLFSLGTEPLAKRLADWRATPAELAPDGGRGAVYQATWRMFRDHWVYGIGAGTFPIAYPYYSTERMDWFRRYAHNDWLQYLAELGTVGAVLLTATLLGVFREQWQARRKGHSPDWLATALWLGLIGVALHALVDFPLHIPSIAVWGVAGAALLTIPAVHKRDETRHSV